MELEEIKNRSVEIRKEYHKLEEKYHGSKWTIEEDALAFLTDAGLVGRLTMDNQKRWPDESDNSLEYKISECIWWFMVLSDSMNVDIEKELEKFMSNKEKMLRE